MASMLRPGNTKPGTVSRKEEGRVGLGTGWLLGLPTTQRQHH